jgi:dTDP-4-amino-4,6-dideoxygalactose transaminase
MQKVIGGEFEIDLSKIGLTHTLYNSHLFSSGRSALYHILKLLYENNQFTNVLLPDYLCESVVNAVVKSNFDFDFYQINYDLTIDFESLQSKFSDTSIVLIINYFGCIDIKNQIRMIRAININICIISDNVQGFYAMSQAKEADFSFTSFRKTFPVPDGALVETTLEGLANVSGENTFVTNKIAGGILKHYAKEKIIDDYLYLDYLSAGERIIDENYDAAPSKFSKLLFSNLDFETIAKRRIENSILLLKGLKQIGIEPIIPNIKSCVPLFIPIRLKNRDVVRNKMFSENIFCPIHWPPPNNIELIRANELAGTELSLIVDQRYDQTDMQRMLDILTKFQ